MTSGMMLLADASANIGCDANSLDSARGRSMEGVGNLAAQTKRSGYNGIEVLKSHRSNMNNAHLIPNSFSPSEQRPGQLFKTSNQNPNYKSARQGCKMDIKNFNLLTARDDASKSEFNLQSNRYKVLNLGGMTRRSDCRPKANYLTDLNLNRKTGYSESKDSF